MACLTHYEDFIEHVNRLGFLPTSSLVPGFPSLGSLTRPEAWHTGSLETDPWQWKDRAAVEKRLAFGCVLGGHKGFIAPRMYAPFYAACHPRRTLEDQWTAGELNQTTWRLWKLFGLKEVVSTDEIRRQMGVSKSQGAGRIDAAVVELQRSFFITVAGNRRKINQAGMPYGWPAMLYARVSTWVPPEWLVGWASLHPEDAAEAILDAGLADSPGVDRQALARELKIKSTHLHHD
jgi:hypothetical protein